MHPIMRTITLDGSFATTEQLCLTLSSSLHKKKTHESASFSYDGEKSKGFSAILAFPCFSVWLLHSMAKRLPSGRSETALIKRSAAFGATQRFRGWIYPILPRL